jgi:glucokinase
MNATTVLAIDIGGTKTAFAKVVLPAVRVLERHVMPTPSGAASGEPFLAAIEATARAMVQGSSEQRCGAIGIGICELVDLTGKIESSFRVHWKGLPVAARLSTIAPVRVDSDVRAAALAEARLGAGRPFRQFLYVNIGTGISSAWVVDGHLFKGANGHAIVLASNRMTYHCPSCGQMHTSTLEERAGGAGLAQCYANVVGHAVRGASDVIDAAQREDPAARMVIDRATAALGSTLATVLGVLDPEALVIGGGLGSAPGPYWEGLAAAISSSIWSPATQRLAIVQAELGPDSGLIGAALLAATGDTINGALAR